MTTQADCVVQVGRHTQLRLTVWLRGVEVAVKGYVEPADRAVGIMQESLVIEELVPLTPNSRWREPDIDELLDSGEYFAINNAFFDTYDSFNQEAYIVWCAGDYYELTDDRAQEKWLAYWMPWTAFAQPEEV